jgi:hypothetical protein
MKSLLVIISALSSASLLAQGTLYFANDTTTRLMNGAGVNYPPAGSTAYSAGIYWGNLGTAEGALILLPAASNGVTQTWSPFSGIFNGGIATFPVPAGTPITLQIRVWTSSYPDYQAASLSGAEALRLLVQQITLGGGAAGPQSLVTPTGAGDTPFQSGFIPEPGTLTLAMLGGLSLLLGRKKNVRANSRN